MRKSKLITTTPKRLFVFGCSVTNYHWVTWPEIIACDLGCDLFNFAYPANSNELIFNSFMQADSYCKFDKDDLVIICWTGITRESRFYKTGWIRSLYRDVHNKWIKNSHLALDHENGKQIETDLHDEYADVDNFLLKSSSYLKACADILDYRKCQSHHLSLSEISNNSIPWFQPREGKDFSLGLFKPAESIDYKVERLYKDYLNKLLPSMNEILYQNDFSLKEKQLKKQIHKDFNDPHPLPLEYLYYLEQVFDYKFKQETVDRVHKYNDDLIALIRELFDNGRQQSCIKELLDYKHKNYIAPNRLLDTDSELRDLLFYI